MELFLSTRIVPGKPVWEMRMRRKKPRRPTLVDAFWAFLRDNPELATMMAFELGSLAGSAVRTSAQSNKYLKNQVEKVPQAIADAMPPGLSSALKFLPAPKLQPGKRTNGKRSPRKAKHAA
jgi:hypothetical protein